MISRISINRPQLSITQDRHDQFQTAFAAWQVAHNNTENWLGDDEGTRRLCSDEATAVDTLMSTPAPNVAGVISKLDSMWSAGGEWRNDPSHRKQIVIDLQSFKLNFSDVSVEV